MKEHTLTQTTRGRMIPWLLKPGRVIRLTVVLLLSMVVASLTLPPEPDATLPVPHGRSARFSPDGSRLLIVSEKNITNWDVAHQENVGTFFTFFGDWEWLPDSKTLVVISLAELKVIDAASGETIRSFDVNAHPPESWTSARVTKQDSELASEVLRQLSESPVQTHPTGLRLITKNLVAVEGTPSESWRVLLQESKLGSGCERRFRLPDLQDCGAELWQRLQPAGDRDPPNLLIAAEYGWTRDRSGGWRILDADTLRTRLWIAEASSKARSAGLNADNSVLMTGPAGAFTSLPFGVFEGWIYPSSQADELGVRLYDATTGGLLNEFPDEVAATFSTDRTTFATLSDGRARIRDSRSGALVSETSLTPDGRSTPERISVRSTHHETIPFVSILWGGNKDWLSRLRYESPMDVMDLKQGSLLARLPYFHALSPNLDWAVELRKHDVALWKLHGSHWRLSWKHAGLALVVVLAVLLIEMLWGLWFVWLRSIGAIDAKKRSTP